jgi:hypothetical protein
MKRTIVAGLIVFSLILLPNLTHAQSIQDRVLGLFRYFQGSGLAAVKKAPTSTTFAPLSGDGIVYSSDALYTWSGTSPETLAITQGTVTFTTNTFSFHPNLIVSVSAGNVLFQVPNSLTGITLNGGSATLATGTNNVLTTKSLSITGSSYLDITNGGVIVDYSGTSPLATIKGYLLSGRPTSGIGNATWTGNGIRSSSAASAQDHDAFTVGYAENKDMPLGSYSASNQFMGQSPDLTSVLIRFTQATDADLDGKTGDNDVTIIGAHYDQDRSAKSFFHGDFDYSGSVGDSDVTLLGAYYNEFLQVNELVATPSSSSVTLNWNKLYTGSTIILKQIGAGAQFQLTSTAISSLTDSAVTPGTIYTYQVKGSNGQLSNLVQVKVPAVSQVPAAPSNLVATTISSTQINLTWIDNSTNETGFVLEKKIGTGSYSTVASPFQNATSYPNTVLTPGTTYTYRIKATNASGDSTYSNEATATTQATNCGTLCVPAYSSNPGAPYTIYLDFDGDPATTNGNGATIPGGTPVYSYDDDKTTFNTTELANIQNIWTRMSEKLVPFNVNVTTVDPGAPYANKVSLHVMIGGDGLWFQNGAYGGATGFESFYDPNKANNAYNFSDQMRYDNVLLSEQLAFTIGQSFGLFDQNQGQPNTDDQRTIAPIMGKGSSIAARGVWWKNNTSVILQPGQWQDDVLYFAGGGEGSTTNSWSGLGYRNDDYGNTLQTATPLTVNGATKTKSGIIERSSPTTDIDYFSFTTAGGSVTVNVISLANPVNTGPTLDPILEVYNSSGTLIGSADVHYTYNLPRYAGDSTTLNLAAGTYYVAVKGHGIQPVFNGTTPMGYSNDVGSYTVTVTGP